MTRTQTLLADVTAVMVERAHASTRPREGLPADVVYDVPADHDVLLSSDGDRLSLIVRNPAARPEVADVLSVHLSGAEQVSDEPDATVYAGFEFARGDVRRVTCTLVRGPAEVGHEGSS